MNYARAKLDELKAEAQRRGIAFDDEVKRDALITLLRQVTAPGEEELDGMSHADLVALGNERGVKWPVDPANLSVDGLLEMIENHVEHQVETAQETGNGELIAKLDQLLDLLTEEKGLKRGDDVSSGFINPDKLSSYPKVWVLIQGRPEPGGDLPITVGFNGKQWMIPRDVAVEIPEPLIGILMDAKQVTFHQAGKADPNTGAVPYVKRTALRHGVLIGETARNFQRMVPQVTEEVVHHQVIR